jgi:hypothetical protein
MSNHKPLALQDNYKRPIDFFARRTHFIDHLLPIWEAIPEDYKFKGKFYIPDFLEEYALGRGFTDYTIVKPEIRRRPMYVFPSGKGPLVCTAYHDMEMGFGQYRYRPFILMEHGVGLVFQHAGYAGGLGLRKHVALFLAPNEYIKAKTKTVLPNAPQVVIGTPKMDRWAGKMRKPTAKKKPLAVISFHWEGGMVAPEASNALHHYVHSLKKLKSEFNLKGHGHPKFIEDLRKIYTMYGIETIEHFDDVLEQADLYINDCSSTMYEFCLTGKPVIILNAPKFRRDIAGSIRFWDYTDIGPQVNEPEELAPTIHNMLEHPDLYYEERKHMVNDLYPFRGSSAQRAADAILNFCEGKRNV